MKFMDSHYAKPLVELSLNQGETVHIQRGSAGLPYTQWVSIPSPNAMIWFGTF